MLVQAGGMPPMTKIGVYLSIVLLGGMLARRYLRLWRLTLAGRGRK